MRDPVLNVGSWASGGNMNTARYITVVQELKRSSLAWRIYSSPTVTANVEQYNGSLGQKLQI